MALSLALAPESASARARRPAVRAGSKGIDATVPAVPASSGAGAECPAVDAAVGPGMTKGHTITITPADIHLEVRVDGEIVAETDHPRAARRDRPAHPLLPAARGRAHRPAKPTTFQTQCPFKGTASYWTLELGGKTHDGIVWAYENPIPEAEGIAGLMSFYNDRVELTVGS